MDQKTRKRVLGRLDRRGVTLEDLAQSGDTCMCYPKDSTDLEDPVSWYGWDSLEGIGIISDERLAALEARAEPTDREMQSFCDEIVRDKLSSEAEMDDLPSAHFCTLPEEFGTQVLVILVAGNAMQGFDFGLFGLFENKGRAIDALRKNFFVDCDFKSQP
jgi:hypothetical protein